MAEAVAEAEEVAAAAVEAAEAKEEAAEEAEEEEEAEAEVPTSPRLRRDRRSGYALARALGGLGRELQLVREYSVSTTAAS